jgi:hypothetical protein
MPHSLSILCPLSLLLVGCITVDVDGGSNDDGCSSHDECEWDEFCYDAECQAALDRDYSVSIYSAQVDEQKPDGSDWDAFGGAPDLYIKMYMEDGDSCVTDTRDDDFSPTWNQSCSFVFDGSDTFWIEIWDEDISDDDGVFGWYFEASDGMISMARGSGVRQTLDDSSGTIEVEFRIDPNF